MTDQSTAAKASPTVISSLTSRIEAAEGGTLGRNCTIGALSTSANDPSASCPELSKLSAKVAQLSSDLMATEGELTMLRQQMTIMDTRLTGSITALQDR